MGLLDRFLSPNSSAKKPSIIVQGPIIYSWILTNKFAIGPIPKTDEQWQQLDSAGFRSRFSCCYPEEDVFAQPPAHWRQASVSLPDHRRQESLKPSRLNEALLSAQGLIDSVPATYIHCFAGRERSALVAVGLIAKSQNLDVFNSLDLVRLCHPQASPIFGDLDILDSLIN